MAHHTHDNECTHTWMAQHTFRFTIDVDMLPMRYIPYRLADKMLFVGKAVQLLRSPTHSKRVVANSTSVPPAPC